MKKILSFVMILCLTLGLLACGGNTGGQADTQPEEKGQFMVGFSVQDITPDESVPMRGYGDAQNRRSEGLFSYLEAEALAVRDAEGEMVVFVVADLTYGPDVQGQLLRQDLSKELGIPEKNIILSGTHTHNSVANNMTSDPAIGRYNEKLVNGVKEAVRGAVADLKPAEIYVGSIQTEGLNFVKRYIMDDGSLIADNFPGTGTTIVSHETEADRELQLMKFVREGGKDILVANFQTHPHFEGKQTNISAEIVGAFREAVKANLDVHCLYWQGAAGNLNSRSRIGSENTINTRNEWGEKLCSYAMEIYDQMTKVESGPVKVLDMNYPGTVNHSFDKYITEAQAVRAYFAETGDANATADYAMSLGVGIHSVYHANRIVGNSNLPNSKDIYLTVWSFGDVAGVVMAQEMYDTTGMILKEQSPFEMTFIVSYSWPAYDCYIPTAEAYAVGGYEADNSIWAPGTAEEITAEYLNLLKAMHE